MACPARRARHYIGPASALGDPAGRLGASLSADAVSDLVHAAAQRAGLPHADIYSAHSLRADGATAAYRAGAPVSTIAAHGRWAPGSPVVLSYIRSVDRWKDNAPAGIGL